MHILHENEEIEARVAERLHKTGAHSLARLGADCIPHHTVMGELTLLRREPASSKRLVWEKECANDRYAHSYDSLDDKEPGKISVG